MKTVLCASLVSGIFLLPFSPMLSPESLWAKPPSESSAHYEHKDGHKTHHGHQKKKHHKTKIEHKVEHELQSLLKHKTQLGLTNDQVSQLEEMKLRLDQFRIRTKAEVQILDLELHALLKQPETELSVLETNVREAERLKGTFRLEAIKAHRQALQLLTPEQHEKRKSLHKKKTKAHASWLPDQNLGKEHGIMAKNQER